MRDANDTHWIVLHLIDDTGTDATARPVWIRDTHNVLLPSPTSSEPPTYTLSQLAVNGPYLHTSRDDLLKQVRTNMGLTALPLNPGQRAIAGGCIGLIILLVLGLMGIAGSQAWLRRDAMFSGPLYVDLAVTTLTIVMALSMLAVIGWLLRLMRSLSQPPKTQEALDKLDVLLTARRLIICNGTVKHSVREFTSEPYLEYWLDENDSSRRFLYSDVFLFRNSTLRQQKDIHVLVLYAEESHAVL